MYGEIDQLVFLSTLANSLSNSASPLQTATQTAPAAGITTETAPLGDRHASLINCTALDFIDIKSDLFGQQQEVPRCYGLGDWIEDLQHSRVQAAWLDYAAEPIENAPLSAFVPGGRNWTLLVSGHVSSVSNGGPQTERWAAKWEVDNPEVKGQHFWKVTYGCIEQLPEALPRPKPDLAAISHELRDTLQQGRALAGRLPDDSWLHCFEQALEPLTPGGAISFPEHIDFPLLDAYPEAAQRLFSAAYHGWVFGGLGAWNNQRFTTPRDQMDYNRQLPLLYASLCKAIAAASCTFGMK
ncbi:hypothetical protein O4H49_03330 [Kiloniella laminariae]|uniref:Uncharacterized protein n=1 Tax=Kiloniella laminariae TaxID=454162 RepID=A0ABT4LHF7_9PROT|nr:hypothetical protein [Kiloniella laminariae]MCZ4279796.1 hypothetical protein [Kiloniella laminariae]